MLWRALRPCEPVGGVSASTALPGAWLKPPLRGQPSKWLWAQIRTSSAPVWGAAARTSAPLIVRRGRATTSCCSSRSPAPYRSPPRVAAPSQPAPSGGTYGRGSDNFDLARLRPDQPHLLPRLVRRHLQPEQHHQARLSRVSASLANGQKRHGNVMIVPILPACIRPCSVCNPGFKEHITSTTTTPRSATTARATSTSPTCAAPRSPTANASTSPRQGGRYFFVPRFYLTGCLTDGISQR